MGAVVGEVAQADGAEGGVGECEVAVGAVVNVVHDSFAQGGPSEGQDVGTGRGFVPAQPERPSCQRPVNRRFR